MFEYHTSFYIKFCGFQDASQAQAAIDLGVNALGFNFWPQSKRYLAPEARHWMRELDLKGAHRVGVYVNESTSQILRDHQDGLIDVAQLHGEESPQACQQLLDAGLKVIKAHPIQGPESFEPLQDYPECLLLFDAWCGDARGGSGKTFNWEDVRAWKEQHPKRSFLLAGGLHPENAAQALESTLADGLDLASGIEQSPGDKDPKKMRAFMEAVAKYSLA